MNLEYIPKIGKCGFTNIGNTCYMNSVLQLLVHCKTLVNFLVKINKTEDDKNYATFEEFLNKGSIQRVAEKERKRLRLDGDSQVTIQRSDIDRFMSASITTKLADIINTIILKGNSTITPTSFKQAIDNKFSYFRGMNQHDAHELLIHIIDSIFEETGIESEPSLNNVPEVITEYVNLVNQVKEELKKTNDISEKNK